jgi:rod shape-determining protein MreB
LLYQEIQRHLQYLVCRPGGGSLLSGLEDLIESKTGINTMTAEDPMTAVAIGTGKFIEFLSGYREE